MYGPQTREKFMLECSSQRVMLVARKQRKKKRSKFERFPNSWPCDCAVHCFTNCAINEPFRSWATANLCCRTIHRDTTRTRNCLNPSCFENREDGPVCSAIARSWTRVPGKLGFLFFFFRHLKQIVHLLRNCDDHSNIKIAHTFDIDVNSFPPFFVLWFCKCCYFDYG